MPPELYGGCLRFVNRNVMSTAEDDHHEPADPPQARRRAAQLRQGARRRARGVRGGRRVDRARGDRAARRRRDRHALPPLPEPPGAARGRLRRGGRGDLPHAAEQRDERRPVGGARGWFERFIGYIATKQALAAELLNYLDRDAQLFKSMPRRALGGGRAAPHPRAGGGRRAPRRRDRGRHAHGDGDRQDPVRRPRADRRTSLRIALDGLRYRG